MLLESYRSNTLAPDINAKYRILTLELKEQVTAHQTDEYRDKVVQWLSTTDPSSNHHAACKKHQPTTGKWLLRQAQFTEWKMERNSFLWLYGKRKSLFPLFLLARFILLPLGKPIIFVYIRPLMAKFTCDDNLTFHSGLWQDHTKVLHIPI
jgi:hypothetical protein